MIFRTCIHCGDLELINIEGLQLPKFFHDTCDECGGEMWTKLSRCDAWSMTVEAFRKDYIINDSSMTITERK
jgi:hypothetical protein